MLIDTLAWLICTFPTFLKLFLYRPTPKRFITILSVSSCNVEKTLSDSCNSLESDYYKTLYAGVENWPAIKLLLRFYATFCAILRIGGKFVWRWEYTGSLLSMGTTKKLFKVQQEAYMDIITWISWILLNPSLQKNSIKLDKVLGPGISFRVLILAFSPTLAGVISLSGMASSPAAEIPKASLAADLCKARKMKNSCLFSRSPWRFLQHAVVKWFRMAIFWILFGVSVRKRKKI